MAWMMDTSVAIHLRDGSPGIVDRLASLGDQPVISVVTQVELEGGVFRDPSQVERRRARLAALMETLIVLPFDDRSVAAYRAILAATGFSPPRILDRMIAAQAIATNLQLVTANAADFRDVPALRLIEWVADETS